MRSSSLPDMVYLALVRGEIGDGRSVLTRLHSECLTGDALGSLRCDCGTQLREAAREIAAEGRGVLVYATDHEGRGIGLVNKLRAYMLQEDGADTIDANCPPRLSAGRTHVRRRRRCLGLLGVRSVRLLTNNPSKVEALRRAGIDVETDHPAPDVAARPKHRLSPRQGGAARPRRARRRPARRQSDRRGD